MPQQSPLTMATIAAKLAATEREADAARVRAKIKAARMGRNSGSGIGSTANLNHGANNKERDEGRHGEMGPPDVPKREQGTIPLNDRDGGERGENRKRKATGVPGRAGRASRRRSTLSPWEMESLILGGMGAGSPIKADDGERI